MTKKPILSVSRTDTLIREGTNPIVNVPRPNQHQILEGAFGVMLRDVKLSLDAHMLGAYGDEEAGILLGPAVSMRTGELGSFAATKMITDDHARHVLSLLTQNDATLTPRLREAVQLLRNYLRATSPYGRLDERNAADYARLFVDFLRFLHTILAGGEGSTPYGIAKQWAESNSN